MTRNGTVVARRLYNSVLCSKGFIPRPVYPIPPISTDLLATCLCGTTGVYLSRQPAIPHADTHVRNLRIHECTLAFVLAGGSVGSQGLSCVIQLARRWVLRSHGGESAMRSPPSIRTSVTVPPCKPAAYLYQEVRLTSLVWS